jgi:hypothetical protein
MAAAWWMARDVPIEQSPSFLRQETTDLNGIEITVPALC